jgi:hypothetical protein
MSVIDPVVKQWLLSRLDAESDEYSEGYLEGRDHASLCGDDGEAGGLKEFRARCGDEEWSAFFRVGGDDLDSQCHRLFFLMNPDQDGDIEASDQFWIDFLVDALDVRLGDSAEWYRGFAEGALELWESRQAGLVGGRSLMSP